MKSDGSWLLFEIIQTSDTLVALMGIPVVAVIVDLIVNFREQFSIIKKSPLQFLGTLHVIIKSVLFI